MDNEERAMHAEIAQAQIASRLAAAIIGVERNNSTGRAVDLYFMCLEALQKKTGGGRK